MGLSRHPSDTIEGPLGSTPIGLQLVATDHDHGPPGPDPDPVVRRELAPGLALVVTAAGPGGPWPVHHRHCRRWGLAPAVALALAETATRRLPAERRVWRVAAPPGSDAPPPGRWFTLLRAGPFTTGLVADLARRVPGGDGHGLLVAPDPATLAVVAGPEPLSGAEANRAAEVLWGLAAEGDRTPSSLIQFHPAGEFAIFGRDRKRPDHRMP